jgi:hypothetical protein
MSTSTRDRIIDVAMELFARNNYRGVDDLRTELTLTARYTLAELDNETELLRILASEARIRPELVEGAVQQIITATYSGFAGWLRHHVAVPPEKAREKASAIAAVGLGALLSSRLLRVLLGTDPIGVPDDALVDTWVDMLLSQLPPETRQP